MLPCYPCYLFIIGGVLMFAILSPPNHAKHLQIVAILQNVVIFYLNPANCRRNCLFDLELLADIINRCALRQHEDGFAFGRTR